MHTTTQNKPVEITLESEHSCADPFNMVEVSARFTEPGGTVRIVPAFWAGGQTWKLRYAASEPGAHRYETVCSNPSNAALHGRTGAVEVVPYAGGNPLYLHGPLRVSADGRHLEHLDGTPFFWLGDTWWMGLCKRLDWPGFEQLAENRAELGFTLVQIVAGLYPDMGPFDERGRNEAGFPWTEDWARVRPEYFDMADRRIACLVEQGLVPCIVGCWGYYLKFAGAEALKKHWRYLIARWGAYPVVWCAAGEMLMSWYLDRYDTDEERQKFLDETAEVWRGITACLRAVDPWRRPVTAHPGGRGSREMLNDELVEIEMLQTGHSGFASLDNTVNQVTESVAQMPRMPVINGEVSYEGIGGTCWHDVQRLMFWTCMLSGAAGHTYGANGLWQMSTAEAPYGVSPHGMSWGGAPWPAAAAYPGARAVAEGKRILERYDWWRLEPTPDLVSPRWNPSDYLLPYAATISGQCHIVYLTLKPWGPATVHLEPGRRYRASYVNPATGEVYGWRTVEQDTAGHWQVPGRPVYHDLVLIIEML